MRVDAHQHFWQYNPERDGWITDEMEVIRRDFMPDDLKSLYAAYKVDGCVAVQADQSEEETRFLLRLAEANDWILGVVGWVDLQGERVEERLEHFKANPRFKGVRHILQAEPRGFMTSHRFVEGVKAVGKSGLTYDILTTEVQLDEVLELVKILPEMPLVIDHISKPNIKQDSIDHWKKYMKHLSHYDHVYVKLSGMITEADWKAWKVQGLEPYVNYCLEHFGPDRLMFGSDWPVCLLAGTYDRVINGVESLISRLSSEDQARIMGETAMQFYNLV